MVLLCLKPPTKNSEKFSSSTMLLFCTFSAMDHFSCLFSPSHFFFFYLYCRQERLVYNGVLKGCLTTCLSAIFEAGPSQCAPCRSRKSRIALLKEFDSEQMLWHI